MTMQEFHEWVKEIKDALPKGVRSDLKDLGVKVIVAEQPPEELAWDTRGAYYHSLRLIVLYKSTLDTPFCSEDNCNWELSRRRVTRTLWHEILHAFGLMDGHADMPAIVMSLDQPVHVCHRAVA